MPVVALPLLSLFIDIKSAAMLLSMPLIFSTVPQALEGGKTGRCLMQLMRCFGVIPAQIMSRVVAVFANTGAEPLDLLDQLIAAEHLQIIVRIHFARSSSWRRRFTRAQRNRDRPGGAQNEDPARQLPQREPLAEPDHATVVSEIKGKSVAATPA